MKSISTQVYTTSVKLTLGLLATTLISQAMAQTHYASRVCIQDEYSQQIVCGRLIDKNSQEPNSYYPHDPIYPPEPGYQDQPTPAQSVSDALIGSVLSGGTWEAQQRHPSSRDDRDPRWDRSLQSSMDRVNQLYREVLGRDGDYGSLRHRANEVVRGKSLNTVRHELASSPEARQAIANLYQEVLRRKPDVSGLNSHWDRLQRGATLAQIRSDLANSEEGRRIR